VTTLTTLDDALERLLALTAQPVTAARMPIADAVGRVLAEALSAARDEPPAAVAARDGIAIRAEESDGSGPYAPVVLTGPTRVAPGENMPPATDAVVPACDVCWRGGRAELSLPVAPGDGVREAGRDVRAGTVWRRDGTRLDARDLPLLGALGIDAVSMRVPRVVVLASGDRFGAPGPVPDRIGPCLAALLAGDGAVAVPRPSVPGNRTAIAAALSEAATLGDLVLITGGTGDADGDHAAAALAEAGACGVHGIGLRPGGSAGFGLVAGTPVLLLPGQPADALGAWLAFGRIAVRRLAGATDLPRRRVRLSRKLVSAPGLAELALLRRGDDADAAVPLPAGDLTLSAFACADHYLIVPAGCEGYEAGMDIDCLTI
jgi:molybdopterin molybdotransferase